MRRWILGTIVLAEAVVGILLTALLLLGRSDQFAIVDTLSFIGFLVFAGGILPILSKIRKSMLYESEEESESESEEDGEPSSESASKLQAFVTKYDPLLRAVVVGVIVFANGLGLFYLTGSS